MLPFFFWWIDKQVIFLYVRETCEGESTALIMCRKQGIKPAQNYDKLRLIFDENNPCFPLEF
jgi:hypothetical protein